MKKSLLYLISTVATMFFVACSSNQKDTNETTAIETELEDQSITLFNGKDLLGWYTYQRQPEPSSEVAEIPRDAEGNYTAPIGLNKDPLNVFSVDRKSVV